MPAKKDVLKSMPSVRPFEPTPLLAQLARTALTRRLRKLRLMMAPSPKADLPIRHQRRKAEVRYVCNRHNRLGRSGHYVAANLLPSGHISG